MAKPKKKTTETNTLQVYNEQLNVELNALSDYISQYSTSGYTDVKLADLQNWLRNPIKNIDKLILLSRYFYAKEGIITDVYDMFKTLPVLNWSVMWQNMKMKKFKDYKTKVDDFLKSINPRQLARDTIFSTVQDGCCVWYNCQNKYIAFLEYNSYKIDTMINGKWRVDFDLAFFDNMTETDFVTGINKKISAIESAPEEVTVAVYNAYKKDKTKRFVPLDIDKTHVFKLRGDRNTSKSLPYAVGAMSTIIHRDLLESTEKVLANRINNMIIVQSVGSSGTKENPKPPTQPMIDNYHSALKKILQKTGSESDDSAGTAPLTVPEWVKLEELEIKMNVFDKEVYERIDKNLYQKLGFSPSLNMGGGMAGNNYGSGSINAEKVFSVIFYLLEQIEEAITFYMNQIVTTREFNPSIRFSRATLVDKETQFNQAKELYLQGRGSLKYWVESAGYEFDHYINQTIYENDVLNLDEILPIHLTSYTQSGDSGRPTDSKTKDQYNNNPKPNPSDSK